MSDPESGARAAMGLVMIALSLVGIILIKGAVDLPMFVFGTTLFIFGVGYTIGLVRQHFNAVDRAIAEARVARASGGQK